MLNTHTRKIFQKTPNLSWGKKIWGKTGYKPVENLLTALLLSYGINPISCRKAKSISFDVMRNVIISKMQSNTIVLIATFVFMSPVFLLIVL